MEGVQCVVDGRALFGLPVSCTQEHPLLRCRHLLAYLGITLVLKPHCHCVQLVAKLPQVFVLPCSFILAWRRIQDGFYICVVFPDQLLNILLDCGMEKTDRQTNGPTECVTYTLATQRHTDSCCTMLVNLVTRRM